MDDDVGEPLSGAHSPQHLTAREREVLRFVGDRYHNGDIAKRLGISKRTVESHVASLMRKLGAQDRGDVIATAGTSVFRTALTEALRTNTHPVEIQKRAAELLGRHLSASRAYYQEFDRDAGTITIHSDYTDGPPSIAGSYVLADYGTDLVDATFDRGRTLVVPDADELESSAAACWRSMSVRAALVTPNMRDGECVAALGITSLKPRAWTDEDVALLEETAERTWSCVERARLDHELREAEHRFRTLADSVPALVWQTDADAALVFANRAFRDFTGLACGDSTTDLVTADPTRDHDDTSHFEAALRQRRSWRGQAYLQRRDGSFHVFDCALSPRFDPDDSYLGQLGLCHEVSVPGPS